MAEYTVISADSHMIEPPNLWTERLDRKYRDSAPHVEENERGSFFVAPGIQPSRVSLGFAAGRSGKELQEYFKKGNFEAARPSGWDGWREPCVKKHFAEWPRVPAQNRSGT